MSSENYETHLNSARSKKYFKCLKYKIRTTFLEKTNLRTMSLTPYDPCLVKARMDGYGETHLAAMYKVLSMIMRSWMSSRCLCVLSLPGLWPTNAGYCLVSVEETIQLIYTQDPNINHSLLVVNEACILTNQNKNNTHCLLCIM